MPWLPLFGLGGVTSAAVSSSWVVLSGGLPDRYRLPFAGLFLLVTTGGLVWLSWRIRGAEPSAATDPNAKLERADLLAGGSPENTLEWLIKVGSRPATYAGLAVILLGTGLIGFVVGGALRSAGTVSLFGAMLVLMKAFLRFGWPYIERFYESRQPDERNPNSMRYQGFSRDTMIFLTLAIAGFVGIFGLIALEAMLL